MVLIRAKGGQRTGFARTMAGLALFAILALVLLPTAGRVAAPLAHAEAGHAAADAGPGSHASHDGHDRHAGVAATGVERKAPAPFDPEAPHEDHGDCAYCPLLASLLLLGVVRLPPRVAAPASDWLRLPRVAALRFIHPCGLGSRGPPVP